MKKQLLFLLFFIGTNSFAQSIPLWERELESADNVSAIVTLSEERFMLLGTKVDEGKSHLYLAELDIEGTLLWDSLYTDIEGFGGGMVLTPKGTLAIVSANYSEGIFLEVTTSGEILNTRIHEGYSWRGEKMVAGIEGGFVVTEGLNTFQKLDETGNIEWSFDEEIPAYLFTDLMAGTDKRYHGLGTSGIHNLDGSWNILFSHINEQGFLERIDTLKNFSGDHFSLYQDAYGMIQAKNGDFIIVGSSGHWGFFPMFLRVNELGHILPSSSSIYSEDLYDALLIEPLDSNYLFSFQDYRALEVYENSNGVFTLIGDATTDYEAVHNQIGIWIEYKKPFILQVDAEGKLLCYHTFLDEIIESFELSADNQHVVLGATYSCSNQLKGGSVVIAAKTHTSDGSSDMHLFRFDVENLCKDIETTDIEDANTEPFFLRFTPNPVREKATIHYQIPKDAVLRVYDYQGKIINNYQLLIINSHLMLEVKDWASGVYLYSLEIGGERVNSGKLIVEN